MIVRACLILLYASLSNAFNNYDECLNYTVYPVQYDLSITPYILDKRGYYDCDLVITILANAPDVQILELDADDFLINGNIHVIDKDTNIDLVNSYRPYEYIRASGMLRIYLNTRLKQYSHSRTQYDMKISFRKNIKDDKNGVFLAEYDHHGHFKNLLVTRLSPNKAKYFFPCFNNLQYESHFKFRVRLIQGRNYDTALVIAEEQKRYNENNKKSTVIEFAPSKQISVHQVGFHLSDYDRLRVTSRHTNDTLMVWAPKHKLQYYKFTADFARNITNIIHEYAKINRPIVNGVINIVSVPKNLDGYEIDSWNLLTNGENRLSYDTRYMSVKQKEEMMFELVQQLTRVWLGNPGEPQERTKWTEQWFKEGVATYLANYFLATYHHYPMEHYMIQTKHKAMNQDWLHTTPFLTTFDNTFAVEIPPRYKELVARKTASLLWMVENWVGTEKFHTALINYINSRRGKRITLHDFAYQLDMDTVECQEQFLNGKTSSNVLKSWFNQPGYPLVEVTTLRNRTPNVVHLKQSQFTFTGHPQTAYKYLIPISYWVQRHGGCYNCLQPRFTVDAETYSFEENLDGGWILLNRNAAGYYRVNYDTETWRLIARALQKDLNSIDNSNRAQIVNDVFAIYAAGHISYDVAVEVLKFLENEKDENVWQAAVDGFKLIEIEGANCNMTHLMFDEWKIFMRNCVNQVYESIIDSHEDKTRLFRSVIREFACYIGHQNCLFRLNSIYSGYLRGTNVLHPDLRAACYYNAFNSNGQPRPSNLFEEEDKTYAQFKWQTYRRFWHHIPQGYRRPLEWLSTTPEPTETTSTIVAAKVGPNSGNQLFSSVTTSFLLFLNVVLW